MRHDASEPAEVTDQRAADEADSLRIGEELAREQEQLLAGKYRNAEELEKAYLELQGKLGSPEQQQPVESPQEEPQPPSTADLLERYQQGDKDALEGLTVEALAEAYQELKGQDNSNDSDLSEDQVNTIYNAVGGEEQYAQMMQWASQYLQPEEIAAYDAAIDSANMASINLALRGLISAYQDANGVEGRTIQGKTPASSTSNVFRSQAELIAAMNDPRYDSDPAYRMDVMSKLEMSPELQF